MSYGGSLLAPWAIEADQICVVTGSVIKIGLQLAAACSEYRATRPYQHMPIQQFILGRMLLSLKCLHVMRYDQSHVKQH